MSEIRDSLNIRNVPQALIKKWEAKRKKHYLINDKYNV